MHFHFIQYTVGNSTTKENERIEKDVDLNIKMLIQYCKKYCSTRR